MAARADRSKSRSYGSLAPPKPIRAIGMIWHKDRYQNPLTKEFTALVRQLARSAANA
jgi:DNA-binding transcriptional LysR family regulator